MNAQWVKKTVCWCPSVMLCLAAASGCREGEPCGGLAGTPCGINEFCNYDIEAQCGAADQTGICTQIPDACTLEFAPVCGCDGNTYSNECSAAAAGISIISRGACEIVCGGDLDVACPDGLYCQFEIGDCGEGGREGVCATMDIDCDNNRIEPVCGCDGITYNNDCLAASAGVNVEIERACDDDDTLPDGRACGGFAGTSCDENEYCRFELDAMCGIADATGVCTAIPENCTEEFNPVCGCDGVTYPNECFAAAAGTGVLSEGECDDGGDLPQGAICGGIAGEGCPEGQYCQLPQGQCCCDFQGVCTDLLEACPEIFAPVCGCDGETYDNDCFAAAAGVTVDHEGACEG